MAAYDKFFMPDYFRIYGPRETLKPKEQLRRLKTAFEKRKAKGTDDDVKFDLK